MQYNANFRGMPQQIAFQPHSMQMRPSYNHIDSNNSNFGYGHLGYPQAYPSSLPNFHRNRLPMFPSVYQHSVEDYRQAYNCDSSYFEMPFSNHFNKSLPHPHGEYYQGNQPARSMPKTALESQQSLRPNVSAKKRNSTAAPYQVPKQKILANPVNNVKTRRINPPMAMLPAPKPINTKNDKVRAGGNRNPSTSQQKKEFRGQKTQSKQDKKSQQQQILPRNEDPLPQQLKLSGARVLTGSIQQLLKWSLIRHKIPPLYETIGIVIEMTRENLEQRTVDHFRIRSLTQWNFGNASMQPLVCVAYNSDTYDTFPIDSCVRIVGHFLPSELFHCLKIRRARESDILLISSKVTGQEIKVVVNPPCETFAEPFSEAVEMQHQTSDDPMVHYSLFTPF